MEVLPITQRATEAAEAGFEMVISAATTAACVRAFGKQLRGIVLTGSLARKEATFVPGRDGWTARGDAEFFVVFHQQCSLPEVGFMESVRREVERTLVDNGIRCPIDLSSVHPSYLCGLPPSIMAYELRECGKVVWGDRELLSTIPPFPATAILLEDAWRLLCNRMVEFLGITADLLQPDRPLSPPGFYRTVKLYLDIATSFLLFAGQYEPTYAGRAARLRLLAARLCPALEPPFPLGAFAERIEFCMAFKLGGQDMAALQESQVGTFWRDAVQYAHSLWRWELRQLTRSADGLEDRELMRAWMRRQPVYRRVRGWLRVVRDCDWRRSCCAWPRWLVLASQASPRYWVYAAGGEIFFRLSDAGKLADLNAHSICRWLPLMPHKRPVDSEVLWVKASAAVLSNYQSFIAATRA